MATIKEIIAGTIGIEDGGKIFLDTKRTVYLYMAKDGEMHIVSPSIGDRQVGDLYEKYTGDSYYVKPGDRRAYSTIADAVKAIEDGAAVNETGVIELAPGVRHVIDEVLEIQPNRSLSFISKGRAEILGSISLGVRSGVNGRGVFSLCGVNILGDVIGRDRWEVRMDDCGIAGIVGQENGNEGAGCSTILSGCRTLTHPMTGKSLAFRQSGVTGESSLVLSHCAFRWDRIRDPVFRFGTDECVVHVFNSSFDLDLDVPSFKFIEVPHPDYNPSIFLEIWNTFVSARSREPSVFGVLDGSGAEQLEGHGFVIEAMDPSMDVVLEPGTWFRSEDIRGVSVIGNLMKSDNPSRSVLNKILVPSVNDRNMRRSMTRKEITDLDLAIASGGSDLLDHFGKIYDDSVSRLAVKRLELRRQRIESQRGTIRNEIHKLVFRKVGALAYKKAMS